ncbi:PREDICTED: uncharacterized protein LOC109131295 [Camelina sativa]|uniref:Uncharacterized protein LOC109131295 n=1 Tax=Camelina sativa TaxID=90675 RepID=A0ABM1RF20_CAMSA|nr:PREDICTED: uncharacterized protein LOC109131295 [Camelina sativa]
MMMMGGGESEKQRSVVLWKLKVCVRAERFSLKLNLRNRLSSWKLHRFSFVLRFRNHHLKVDSQSKPDRVRFIRSLAAAIFRRRRRREAVDAKTLIELVWNRAVVAAKKARGVGAAVTLIIIVANYLMPWIKLRSEPFQLY